MIINAKAPIISIIMPLKNGLPFLKLCIDSIICQSFKSWELIVVDDHSTDNSVEILKDYTRTDSRIKTITNLGKGIIDALQTGYKLSTGNLISRMDADDIMPKQKLELLFRAYEKEDPNCLVTAKVKYFSDSILHEGYKNYQDWLNGLHSTNDHYLAIYKECVIASPNWIMSRSTFDKIGAFNSETYPEDYDLCFRIYKHKIKIHKINETTHLWRDHQTRTSRTDDNYKDNSFLDLKLKYFLDIDHDKNNQLVLWGAGKKAKKIARILIDKSIDFNWISNNEKKVSNNIYGKIIANESSLVIIDALQIIIAVANPLDQLYIRSVLENHKLQEGKTFYFFC